MGEATNVEEISAHGMRGTVDGKEVLVGNARLLKKFNVPYPAEVDAVEDTIVVCAIDGAYAGYLTVADKIKDDAKETISLLKDQGIREIVMLSGDKTAITQRVAATLGITKAFGDLLPEDKVTRMQEAKKDPTAVVAFVGDGINDAPVLALSDVGIAMGGLGSDAAIETADVVLQNDRAQQHRRSDPHRQSHQACGHPEHHTRLWREGHCTRAWRRWFGHALGSGVRRCGRGVAGHTECEQDAMNE